MIYEKIHTKEHCRRWLNQNYCFLFKYKYRIKKKKEVNAVEHRKKTSQTGCPYIEICEKFNRVTGICLISGQDDLCRFRPDRVIRRQKIEIDDLRKTSQKHKKS